MTGSFPGLSLHMHIHAHAVGKGPLLALFLCRKKNGGCTFLPKDASQVTGHVGWTRAGTFWVSLMREELAVLPCPRRATLRPPGAEEISRAVSAHKRPTAWSLSGCGLGVGGLRSWGTVHSCSVQGCWGLSGRTPCQQGTHQTGGQHQGVRRGP